MLKKGRDACKEDLGGLGGEQPGSEGPGAGCSLSSEHRCSPRSCCKS